MAQSASILRWVQPVHVLAAVPPPSTQPRVRPRAPPLLLLLLLLPLAIAALHRHCRASRNITSSTPLLHGLVHRLVRFGTSCSSPSLYLSTSAGHNNGTEKGRVAIPVARKAGRGGDGGRGRWVDGEQQRRPGASSGASSRAGGEKGEAGGKKGEAGGEQGEAGGE
jgi:hypothetical protein